MSSYKKYRMYIDEVGNSDLGSSDDPLHRYLSLTGIIIDLEYVKTTLFYEMEKLKAKFFEHHPDTPIILHRKELVNAKHPFQALKDEHIKSKFNDDLIQHFNNWEYAVITVCIDKKSHKDNYKVWRYDPYHYCLAVLLERYIRFLEGISSQGDVLAESRGGKEDKRLKASFEKLWNEGTQYIGQERIQNALTSKQLKIKPKDNNISGLQIADLIAHPSRNEILKENGHLEKPIAPFATEIINIIQKKYYSGNGRVYGKKFI